MQTCKIIKSPHLLYTGANNHKTFGITVESIIRTEKESRELGYQHSWNMNDYIFLSYPKEFIMDALDLTSNQYDEIKKEFIELMNEKE